MFHCYIGDSGRTRTYKILLSKSRLNNIITKVLMDAQNFEVQGRFNRFPALHFIGHLCQTYCYNLSLNCLNNKIHTFLWFSKSCRLIIEWFVWFFELNFSMNIFQICVWSDKWSWSVFSKSFFGSIQSGTLKLSLYRPSIYRAHFYI